MASHLTVRQVRSNIGRSPKQRAILLGLGLKRTGKQVCVPNTPAFRGMIKKVLHLVHIEEKTMVVESHHD